MTATTQLPSKGRGTTISGSVTWTQASNLPSISPIPDQTGTVGVEKTVDFLITNQVGSMQVTANIGSVVSIGGGLYRWTYTPTVAGAVPVVISAATPGGTVTEPFTLTSTAAPQLPQITAPSPVPGVAGQLMSFDFTVTGNPTSVTTPIGTVTNLGGGNYRWSYTPAGPGTSTMTITATNAAGTATRNVTLAVVVAPAAPAITADPFFHANASTPIQPTFTVANTPTTVTASEGTVVDLGGGQYRLDFTSAVRGAHQVTITASNAGGTVTRTVTVYVAVIDFVYTPGAFTPTQIGYMEEARSRLNRIFVGALPAAATAWDAAYTGIAIDVTLGAVENGILARAAPVTTRSSGLGLTGRIWWNPEALGLSRSTIMAVTIHEAFHTFAFHHQVFLQYGFASGGNCGPDGLADTADDVSLGLYTAPIALAHWRAASGNPTAPGIPMQCSMSHWDETALDVETLTPIVNTLTVLSAMSIGVLEDLGYSVSYSEADPW